MPKAVSHQVQRTKTHTYTLAPIHFRCCESLHGLRPARDVISILNGNTLGHVIHLVNADQARGKFKHVVPQTNHDELGIARALLDVAGDDADIAKVERGIDFIHDVQWRGLVVVQREHEGKRGQGFLAAREVGDDFVRLLGRLDAELDAFEEGVCAVGVDEVGETAHGNHLVHFLESGVDEIKACLEFVTPPVTQFNAPGFDGVARGGCFGEVSGARGVFFDTFAVFFEHGEVDLCGFVLLF